MKKTQFEHLMESPEFRKLYAVEGLVTEAGEFIARLMEERKVSKAELARRMGRSRAYITQLLSGSTNLTVRTLAEVAYALGVEVKLESVPLESARHEPARAEAPPPVYKVVQMERPASRTHRPTVSGGLRPRPGDAYCYVA
jgi:transcriptional regulator with XRE-family HTH domain